MKHPYTSQPDRAFWSRAVSNAYDECDVVSPSEPLLQQGDRVMSAGSCFASEMVPWLEAAGLEYIRTEVPHPAFQFLPENFGYRDFSAAYGNIYTARHLKQLLKRALGLFKPAEDRWYDGGRVIDPFRPGLRHPATSDDEFDLLSAQHLQAVLAAFRAATVFVFTLGLTEGWESVLDGAVFPTCPGTVAGTFDPERHVFHNFSIAEVEEDLAEFLDLLWQCNPDVCVILTVSPVPLVATATQDDVLVATTFSKSVLRVAAAELAMSYPRVRYFPAYEIVTGPQAPAGFFAEDRRTVTAEGVRAVMRGLLANIGSTGAKTLYSSLHEVPAMTIKYGSPGVAQELSRRVTEAECEEVMVDR